MLRSTLLKLAESKGFANWVTSNGTTRRMARRFVAGETLDEAIAAARECNNLRMHASLDLLAYGCRIRLCKGAYKEPEDVAYPRKVDVDANFVRLMQTLLSSGFYHGIATHDPRTIAATIRHAAAEQISKDDFEFQMLYGVRTDLQRRLVKDGYRVRIYIPYGKDWFPYFMRRLAERPANLGFILRNFFRK